MAEKEFILQGFSKQTHVDAVRGLFDIPDIQSVVLSVAFVSESGVQQIEKKLKPHAAHLTVLAGIRNDITSHQGLARLYNIGGSLYTVDTGSRTVIFHPKVYLVRGEARARLVVGSANLTLGGLNNNIEAGMLLDFDLAIDSDKAVVDEIEHQLSALPASYPDNVVKIGDRADLDKMLDSGRLVDETALPAPRPATSARGGGAVDTVPRIKLKVVPLRRTLAKAKAVPKRPKVTKAQEKGKLPALEPVPATVGVGFELVWKSKPLTRRDLTIPTAAGTHATGSVNLDKGLLPGEVDHRHYFRENVFSGLDWAPTNASGNVDEAFAKFQLVIKGISYGEFDLRIGHTTSTTSKAYLQNNAMTRLSWGPARKLIARPDLIDRALMLYRDEADPKRFILEID